jgi:hypothetical protein
MAQPTMMYPPPLASSPSPHQRMARPVEYNQQVPMMVPGGAVYPSIGAPPLFSPVRSPVDRRRVPSAYALGQHARSAVLDEFRANKTRRWELRVRLLAVTTLSRAPPS